MIEWLAGLWDNKRWLFWLLLPLTLLAVGIKYYLDYLEYKADKDLADTEEKDEELKSKQDGYNRKAEEAKAEANKAKERIENREDSDGDEDWHLKR